MLHFQIFGFKTDSKKKLVDVKKLIVKNKLIHIPCCEVNELESDDEIILTYASLINFFDNPMAVEIQNKNASLPLELCELQTDPFFIY